MATTTNFGWETPDDTDLVKDGAAAIRTLGGAIDTSLVDLKGGTTGQVLSKASNTDMDFTWVAQDDSNAIQNAIVDAKGDIITATAADTPARLAVGENGYTLVADSSTSTGLAYVPTLFSGKNKLINSNMVLDQRNSGNAIASLGSGSTYTLDRWYYYADQAAKFSFQQNQGAVTPPAGFSKYIGFTSLSAYTPASTDMCIVRQAIEGNNVADLAFGTASAKTITVSFWVRSSLTGTFGGAIQNASLNRNYPFTYSISAANTWEQKSVTIAGDTTGTWSTDSGTGLILTFALGVGSSRVATAGTWSSSSFIVAGTGAGNISGTNGATWYMTGAQLEIGSSVTNFQTATGTIQGELAAAQRYYWRSAGGSAYAYAGATGIGNTTSQAIMMTNFQVPMRIAPSSIEYSNLMIYDTASFMAVSSLTINDATTTGIRFSANTASTSVAVYRINSLLNNNNTAGYLAFNAEL